MNVFDSVPLKIPAKNVFNLSHDVKSTYNFDKIYPFLVREIYPNDVYNCRVEAFLRTMPLKAPVMHNVDMYFYFIYAPSRLAWNANRKDDWKVFITGGEDGMADPVKPYFNPKDIANIAASPEDYGLTINEAQALFRHGSLLDHFNIGTLNRESPGPSQGNLIPIDSLPFRAYQLIWNEYFRNQNVQDEVEFSYDSGHESLTDLAQLLQIRKKNWEKDYFTAALPFIQRGEAMKLPFDTSQASISVNTDVADALRVLLENGGRINIDSVENSIQDGEIQEDTDGVLVSSRGVPQLEAVRLYNSNAAAILTQDVADRLTVSGISVGTIAQLRDMYRMQMWLENNARCGSRYIEQLLAHFGVVSSDARLQRPELLGGGKIPLIFTDVNQTSATTEEGTPQGTLAGKGVLYGKTGGFRKRFEEHGWLFGLCCIIPRTSYSQGLPRQFTRFHRSDYIWPEFAHLSEQAILNKELYFDMADPDNATPDDVFGYIPRFTEARYIPSSVHGELRESLQYWHFGRLFEETPVLNGQFVQADSRVNVFALEDVASSQYDPFVCQLHLDIKAVQMLPKHAVPSL